MKARVLASLAGVLLASAALAQPQQPAAPAPPSAPAPDLAVPLPQDVCAVPGYILFDDGKLERLKKAVDQERHLNILVLGSGSSLLPAADGSGKAYPGRLEELLRQRFPKVSVNVTAVAKARLTTADMLASLDKVLLDRKPDLVVWQTGTVDAMRGVDPESFRTALDEGIDLIEESGADVVLMNMQYSPRTETMISLSQYADIMRVVARDRSVPLFDRREIMRYWNDSGSFDLNLGTKDFATAYKVHDCLGRALASLLIEAANLDGIKGKPTQ
jgi:hypothetical protein